MHLHTDLYDDAPMLPRELERALELARMLDCGLMSEEPYSATAADLELLEQLDGRHVDDEDLAVLLASD